MRAYGLAYSPPGIEAQAVARSARAASEARFFMDFPSWKTSRIVQGARRPANRTFVKPALKVDCGGPGSQAWCRMDWIAPYFEKNAELAVFLAIGVGYWIGKFKVKGVGFGPVTGSLLAGLLIGSFVHVPVSNTAK